MAKIGKRQYENDYPSVTGVLDGMRKIGLEMWFKYKTIQEINAISSRSKEIGTQLHEVIQSHIETDTMKIETKHPDEIKNAVQSFMLFKKENPSIKLKKSEIQMTSETYKVNGTLDCLGERDGRLIMLDWKSSEKKDKDKPIIYDEALYQVSAYVKMYNDIYKENIDTAIIVSIAKDAICYNIHEINKDYIDNSFENVFLPMLKVWNFKKQEANKAKGAK